uniref:Uncharacterized protein n=1 Tax=Oryza glumipatula TaxID=40148 RepID=A0A0D9ZVV5_9ORYZ
MNHHHSRSTTAAAREALDPDKVGPDLAKGIADPIALALYPIEQRLRSPQPCLVTPPCVASVPQALPPTTTLPVSLVHRSPHLYGSYEVAKELRKRESNKTNNIDVVYTPWYNLKKTPSMDVGQVGFHNSKLVRIVKVEKRINEIVNRLNKTKVERKPDLKAEREAVSAAEKAERKVQLRDKKRREEMERLEKEKQAEIRSYKNLMVQEKMTSNKQVASGSKTLEELEDDFM